MQQKVTFGLRYDFDNLSRADAHHGDWNAYQSEATGPNSSVLDTQQHTWMAVHTGSELLMRTASPFQSGFLYDDSAKKKSSKSEVIQLASSLIKNKNWSEL